MKYLYYPGCSLKGTGKAYEESLLAVFDKLGITVEELAGWNCCGATAYMSVDQNKAFALAARNLALAEQHNGNEPVNLIAPCNACYLVLSKTQKHIGEYQELGSAIIDALTAVGLTYRGNVRVRHPLDVLVNDFGLDKIVQCVDKPLNGLKVACYYGCQVVRPYAEFDDMHNPMTMDKLIRTVGAATVNWPFKARCCGGSLTGTVENAGLELSRIILREARVRGADIIATACPLCQFNLECYQKKMSRTFGDAVDIPVVFFSQLMGTAFGLNARQIGMNRLLVPVNKVLAKA
jgi:heterodisulfide reductase subunit B